MSKNQYAGLVCSHKGLICDHESPKLRDGIVTPEFGRGSVVDLFNVACRLFQFYIIQIMRFLDPRERQKSIPSARVKVC